jgi:CRP-like cAMP-binding protein
VLDGVLEIDVDGNKVTELGPGAVIGERAILETGRATATVTAVTPVRAARIPATDVDRATLEEISERHRRETQEQARTCGARDIGPTRRV